MFIQSKFKYNSDSAIKASKLAYKLKRGTKDRVIFYAIPIAIIMMIAILIFDVKKHNNLVLDIVLISMLIIIETLNLCMPFVIAKSQAKYFKKIEELDYDYFISEYNKGVFKEKIYKDNKIVIANEISIDKLQNYAVFDNYLIVIFSNFAILLFDLNALQEGSKEDLINLVETNILANKKTKKRK